MTIICPWCKTHYLSTTATNCTNCGGTLEYQTNTIDIGPKPQMAPRKLPKKFIRRIKYFSNAYTMIGIVFTVPFFWTIIFPIIGIIFWKKGLKIAEDELIPLEHGTPVIGTITEISKDYSIKINGESPYVVKFTFEIGSKKHNGNVGNIFTDVNQLKQVNDKIWVVYMPQNPDLSSVWPPLK